MSSEVQDSWPSLGGHRHRGTQAGEESGSEPVQQPGLSPERKMIMLLTRKIINAGAADCRSVEELERCGPRQSHPVQVRFSELPAGSSGEPSA